jgi:2-polyprenyl-3-methyl-5-hydroxy-6-metoxy-1,4-benzoquinol methylase
MRRTCCLVCNSIGLTEIIDLGIQPFADTFVPEECLGDSDPAYPLVCDMCPKCGHVQTGYITNPKDRYSELHDYSYTSSNSKFAVQHWETYSKEIPDLLSLPKGAFIVEIGSNDGFLAEQLQNRGFRVLGVDASDYMSRLAIGRKVKTVVALFSQQVAAQIHKQHGKADLIIANNVFNHADCPIDFAKGIATLLGDNGNFVFEQPYWLTSVRSKKIDQVYHEHVSYFSVRSAKKLLQAVGLRITRAEEVNYHGGSLRIYATKAENSQPVARNVREMIRSEERANLFVLATYKNLMAEMLHWRNAFLKKLYGLREKGATIIAVGAPAKGNTFLNFYRMDKTVIDYVTDSSLHKQGKYTPTTRIPIVDDNIFKGLKNPYALVLSWNLIDSLRPKLKKLNKSIRYISPDQKPLKLSK